MEGLSSQNVSNWWHHHLTHCHHRPFCKYRLQNGVDHSFCSDQRKILGLTLLGDCCQEINLEFGFCHYTGVTTNEIIGAVPMTLERPGSTCARLVARIIMKLYALTSASLHKRHSVVASLFDPRPIRQARMETTSHTSIRTAAGSKFLHLNCQHHRANSVCNVSTLRCSPECRPSLCGPPVSVVLCCSPACSTAVPETLLWRRPPACSVYHASVGPRLTITTPKEARIYRNDVNVGI